MKKCVIAIEFLFLTFLVQLPGYAQKSSYDFTYLQQKINGWIDSGYYSGASLAVVKDDHVILEQYFGNYDTGTVSFIASAGKWLAAATIAAVVDEGKLHWTNRVKILLPQFSDSKGEATLAQLLSHTAGFPAYQPAGKPVDIYQTLEASVDHIVNLPADALPGTRFEYGGLSMQVAGRMAELATGKEWQTLFQEKIARPLGMHQTHFTPVDSSGGHAPMLGGGARTTLHDYLAFLDMMAHNGVYKGKRVLSPETIAFIKSNQVRNVAVSPGEFVAKVRGDRRKDVYGLGMWREEVDASGRPTLYSSPSWAGAYPWIDEQNHLYGFFMTHIVRPGNGFSSFLASPVIPVMVREALSDAKHPEVKRGFVAVDSGRLYYEESGKGEPLIFVHGHSFDHTEWEPQFYEFARHYRVIRYDVRGYGRSTMPTEFSNIMHADDLARLMDALQIQKAHVVGLSMGGFIGLDFLVLHPEKLLSVTLASGDIWNGSPGPSTPWTASQIAERRKEISKLYQQGVDSFKRSWFNALTTRNGKLIQSIREPVWNMIYKWEAWQPTHVEPRFLLGSSVVEKLKQVDKGVPVLILTGAVDTGRRAILDYLPQAHQAIVPNAGHVSNLENPAGFNDRLKTFLSTISDMKKGHTNTRPLKTN